VVAPQGARHHHRRCRKGRIQGRMNPIDEWHDGDSRV
jgi:hypothetical protein